MTNRCMVTYLSLEAKGREGEEIDMCKFPFVAIT